MVMCVGVLALQGDYALHQKSLEQLNIKAPLVYKPEDLLSLDGLIIPGGESTALLKLMSRFNWQEAIKTFHKQGKLLMGTCAGMILFAKHVLPHQESLALIDIDVARNAYGRQLESHVVVGECSKTAIGVDECEMVFIRAPKIVRCGDAVDVLATCDEIPVLVREANVLCASFHPEMSQHNVIHKYFFAS